MVLVGEETVLSLEKGAETLLAPPPLVGAKGSWCLRIESMQEWLSHLTLVKGGPAHSAPAPAHQQSCIWLPREREVAGMTEKGGERKRKEEGKQTGVGGGGGHGKRFGFVCVCSFFFPLCVCGFFFVDVFIFCSCL